uniref:Putative partitioning protein ParB n=1 Tax=Polaromonas sp. H8N TaxID=1840297 RepID=A0A2S1FIC1_9BURK|nr:hypothetical protein [Polaromonas sp. H8N]AWD72265.1 putative partitioning protein ParB [Polaromonas sp. H8N]
MSISKPTLNKAATALDFAERKTAEPIKAANPPAEKRVFYAPEGYRRLTINLRDDLHKKLRLMAVEQDCTITDILTKLVTKELEK